MTRYGPTGHPIDPTVCKNGLGADSGPEDCVLDHARRDFSDAIKVLEELRKEVEAQEWEIAPMKRAHLSGIRKCIQVLSKAAS